MKRKPSEWEKIFANKVTDKGGISKMYKQLIQLNKRKEKKKTPKMLGRPKKTLLERSKDIWMANTHMTWFLKK